MKALPEVKNLDAYHKLVFNKIQSFWNDVFFNFLEKINEAPVLNSDETIYNAMLTGKLIYEDGKFKPKTRFSNAISKELEKMGAKFRNGTFHLSANKLPVRVQEAQAQVRIHNQNKHKEMMSYLTNVQENLAFITSKIEFEKEVKAIGKSLDGQFAKSMKVVNVVPMELDSFQLNEIAKNYTYNLDYYIKKWTGDEIIKLRQGIQQLVSKGYRIDEVAKFIQKEKGIGERKAKFLARQETKLLVAEYTKNRYLKEGVTQYRWSTVMDGRERKLHAELNGRIFSWDNPPIIDAHTGERGNPSQTYNCRCKAIPIISDAWWDDLQNEKK